MKQRVLTLTILIAVLGGAPALAAGWWNKEFHYRVPVTVNSLFQKRVDPVVIAEVDFAKLLKQTVSRGRLDPNSVRVVAVRDGKAQVLPSRLLPAKGSAMHVCWVLPGKVAPLKESKLFIYFDIASNGPKPKPDLTDAPGADKLPGTNLVKNPGFEEPDLKNPKGAAHWTFPGKPSAMLCRTDEGAHSGKYCLKLDTTKDKKNRAIYQTVPVEAGKRYLVRCWIKCPNYKTGAAGAWVWYAFEKPRHKEYGNYKTSAGGKLSKAWTRVGASWINVYVKKTKEQRRIPGLLPGTVTANICPSAYYGAMTVYIDDVEFFELPDKKTEPVEVKLGKPERLGA